jgi:hypothetical protein
MKYYLSMFTMLLGLSMFTACRDGATSLAESQSVAQSVETTGADSETPYCIPVGQCKGSWSCCAGETWVYSSSHCGGNHKWCCWGSGHACNGSASCCSHCCGGGCVNFERNCR